MNKMIAFILINSIGLAPCIAEEITPDQEIDNTKTYMGVNYNRQDSKETGRQKIINNRSWFNINVQIIKEGELFKKNKNKTEDD